MAMDKEGLDVAVLFPPRGVCVLGIDGLDPDFAAVIARSYNDWLHDFAGTAPERMYGVAMVAPHDVSSAVEEIRRTVKEYGFRGIFLRPNHVNGRKWSDPYYDPLWEECQKFNLPVGFHEAGRVYLPQPAMFQFCSTFSMFNTLGFPFANMLACADMIFGGVMERFPKLKAAFLEGNCSWVPWLLWRMGEYAATTGKAEYPYLTLTPLEYFQRQCFGAIECDEITAKHIPEYGLEDNMVFSTDYPHLDVKYPHAIDSFLKLPFADQTKRKYLWDNCARMYNFQCRPNDGFEIVGRARFGHWNCEVDQSLTTLPAVVGINFAFAASRIIPLGSAPSLAAWIAVRKIRRNMMTPLSEVTRCSRP